MNTAEIMDAMKYDGALVTIERLQVHAARLEREREALLAACKEAHWEDCGLSCTPMLIAAIAQAEAA